MSNGVDPYDPDAALAALRPRMAAVHARRRRSLGAWSAVAVLALGGVAGASLGFDGGDEESVVTATETTTTDRVAVEADDPAATVVVDRSPVAEHGRTESPARRGAGSEVAPDEKPDPADPDEVPKPPTATVPPPAPKPTTPPPPPPAAAEQHTFVYEGTGTVTVSHQDGRVSVVGVSAEAGWTHRLSHDQGHMIGVEFRKGPVTRWLKVKSHGGTLHVDRHEQVACSPSATTGSGSAPPVDGPTTCSRTVPVW